MISKHSTGLLVAAQPTPQATRDRPLLSQFPFSISAAYTK
jgi:hypothetical protein